MTTQSVILIYIILINGRQSQSITDGSNTYSYKYNEDGIRTSKTINGVTTNYKLQGNNIIFEQTNDNMIYYIYDASGNVIGLKYNNDIYYYEKNIQNDITGIMDDSFNLLAKYEYDSWGNILSIKDTNGNTITDSTNIALVNPFRYRSYYYDSEIGMYYLNSRYYNSEWGRFINADGYMSTGKGILSSNLYSYTENNPINRIDKNGLVWFQIAGLVTGALISGTATIVSNIAVGNNWNDGLFGSLASGAFTGLIATTPLASIKVVGLITASYGGALIENSINEGFESSKNNTSYNFTSVIQNTAIYGSTDLLLNSVISDVYKINKAWYKPTTFKTSFTGNYIRKLAMNDLVATTISKSITTVSAVNAPTSGGSSLPRILLPSQVGVYQNYCLVSKFGKR